ncbi:MAG: DNA polymerase III subunit delta' [Synechococcales bacterium]|nr:DNA polymerase III subunit delta' [Synechococcales bacterium]
MTQFHPAFADLVGQPQAVELLVRAIAHQRIAPAYLFFGAPGIGKRLAAQCFAACLLVPGGEWQGGLLPPGLQQRVRQGNHPDLLWVEPTYLHQGQRYTAAEAEEKGLKRRSPPLIRLEQIRDLTRFLSRPPLEASRSVVVLDQAETMAEAAANALLKTLEEPGQATLILIAPSLDALLPTLVSRCQRIPFRRLNPADLTTVLAAQGHGEMGNHPDLLAIAAGSPGEAIASWQRLQSMPADLMAALSQPPQSLRGALELAQTVTQSLDTEAQLWLIDYLQHQYWQQQRADWVQQLETARRHLLRYVQPRLVWEVTLMNLIQPTSA